MLSEDKLELFTVLQNIADELRSLNRGSKQETSIRQKHSEKRKSQTSVQYGVSDAREWGDLRKAV